MITLITNNDKTNGRTDGQDKDITLHTHRHKFAWGVDGANSRTHCCTHHLYLHTYIHSTLHNTHAHIHTYIYYAHIIYIREREHSRSLLLCFAGEGQGTREHTHAHTPELECILSSSSPSHPRNVFFFSFIACFSPSN